MDNRFPGTLAKSLGAGFVLFVLAALIIPVISLPGWLSGYAIGAMAVVLHLLFSHFSYRAGEDKFVAYYYTGLFIRFLAVLALFIILLLTANFDELSFTVSFIISYIFHSVNEVIFLNQKLKN